MKVKTIISVIIFLAGTLSAADKEDLLFFYFETCPSCEQYIMADEYSEQIEMMNSWKGASYNLANPANGKELKKVLQEKGLPDISRSLPILIFGNEFTNGYDEIGEKLEELQSTPEE